VSEFHGELESLIDELEMYQSSVTDAATLRGYLQDLAVRGQTLEEIVFLR